ncbi:unnamed protein product [Heterobilharzia americana]|nr:unnamed protein product [Heterobilharzia americana]
MIITASLDKYITHRFYNHHNKKNLLLFTFTLLLLCSYTNSEESVNTTAIEYIVENTTNSSVPEISNQTNVKKSSDCSISLAEFIIYFYIQPIICFIGFILNILNVIIFCGPQFSGAAYAYMIAMSLADAITLISYLPSGLVRCGGYFPYCHHPSFRQFRIHLLYYNAYILFPIGNISETASVWFTLVLSIERYLTMSQLGSVYRNKSNTQSSNISSKMQNNDKIQYNEGTLCQEHKENLNENKGICIQGEEDLEQRSRKKEKRTSKWCQELCGLCNVFKINYHSWNNSVNKSNKLITLNRLFRLQRCKSTKLCALCRYILSYTCRNCHSNYSIFFIAFFSILLNLPLFFVQKVVSKPVPSKNPIEQIHNGETSEWVHTSSKHSNNLTSTEYQSIQSQTQVFTALTEFGNSEFYKIFSWTRIMLIQVLPLLVLCLINFYLFRFINVANRRRQKYLLPKSSNTNLHHFELHKISLRCPKANSGSSARWQAAQRKLTILLIVIVGLFIAGQIPQAFAYVTIFEAFNRHFGNVCKRWRCCPPYLIYRSISHMLGLFTYAINFFVYLTLNKHFKQQLKVWCLLVCPVNRKQHKKHLLKQRKPSNYSYNHSKSEASLNSQHKRKPKRFSNHYKLRRRSSIGFHDPKNKKLSIENTDFSSEAVSAPVNIYSSPKLVRKVGFEQINELNSTITSTNSASYPFFSKTEINPIIKSQYISEAIRFNHGKTTINDDSLEHLIIQNSNNTEKTVYSKSTEIFSDHQKQSRTSRADDHHSIITLQPTKCHTEIGFGLNNSLFLYKTFRAYYSHDSVIKNWIFELNSSNQHYNNHLKKTTLSPTCQHQSVFSNRLITNRKSLDNLQPHQKQSEHIVSNTGQQCTHCMDLIMIQNNENDNDRKGCINMKMNSKTSTYSVDNSDSQVSVQSSFHVYCPLVYRESDFDVISVDENAELDKLKSHSSL